MTSQKTSFFFCIAAFWIGPRPIGGNFMGPGEGLFSPKSYVDVPVGPQKSDFLYTNFLPNCTIIPFSKEKHPILTKLGAFYNNLPKIHPIYVIWAPPSLMKLPRSLAYTKFREKAPQKAGTDVGLYHVNEKTPRGVIGGTIDIEYNKRLDRQRPCLEGDLTAGSNL